MGIASADVHLNWLNRFHYLLFNLIDCMMFLSPFLDVTTTVSFLAQLDPELSAYGMLFFGL